MLSPLGKLSQRFTECLVILFTIFVCALWLCKTGEKTISWRMLVLQIKFATIIKQQIEINRNENKDLLGCF